MSEPTTGAGYMAQEEARQHAFEVRVTRSRFAKAVKLADLLEAEGIKPNDLVHMDVGHWQIVERAAQVRGSSPATRALVRDLMLDREQIRNRLRPEVK